MNLFLVTQAHLSSTEADVLNEVGELNGVTLHIRKPGSTKLEMADILERLTFSARKKVMIHEFYELAFEYSLKGIHLPERRWQEVDIASFVEKVSRGQDSKISAACHSVKATLEACAKVDYVFLSPVFETASKPGALPVSSAEINCCLRSVGEKLVPLGGIDLNRARSLKSRGCSGVACMSYVWNHVNPFKACEEILAI